jgi:hypothetical protein
MSRLAHARARASSRASTTMMEPSWPSGLARKTEGTRSAAGLLAQAAAAGGSGRGWRRATCVQRAACAPRARTHAPGQPLRQLLRVQPLQRARHRLASRRQRQAARRARVVRHGVGTRVLLQQRVTCVGRAAPRNGACGSGEEQRLAAALADVAWAAAAAARDGWDWCCADATRFHKRAHARCRRRGECALSRTRGVHARRARVCTHVHSACCCCAAAESCAGGRA